MQNPISITSIASISSLGSNMDAIWENYCNPNHNFQRKDFDNFTSLIAPLGSDEEEEIEKLNVDESFLILEDKILAFMNCGLAPRIVKIFFKTII